MKAKTPGPRRYTAPPREYGNDSGFSYFEASKEHQEALQAEVLKKIGKTEQLPEQLSDAAHALAAQFAEEVGHKFKTDCESGCSYCCYQPATVFPFEAIRIAGVLKGSLSKAQLGLLVEKLKARVQKFKGSSVKGQVNNKTACPLLVDDQCSVYESRPLTCRMAHSFSVKRCRQAFHKDRLTVEIPMSLELLTGVSGIIEGAFEQLPREKLDGGLYELCSAVLAALADSDAASKWAKGDPGIFKDCIRDDT